MPRSVLAVWLLLAALWSARAAEVAVVAWPTGLAAPPATPPPPAGNHITAFRAALATLPESSIVSLSLGHPDLLGITAEQARELKPALAARYALVKRSPVFAKVPSALPYCFSAARPASGRATVYIPDHAAASSPVILFLHCYGGNFVWFQHYLAGLFPSHIIISPDYGFSGGTVPAGYIAECIGATNQRLGFKTGKPYLVGLSEGAASACRLWVASPSRYRGLVCLAAAPPADTLRKWPASGKPAFLSGGAEPQVVSGEFAKRLAKIKAACPGVTSAILPGATKFFMATHAAQTGALLQRWIGK